MSGHPALPVEEVVTGSYLTFPILRLAAVSGKFPLMDRSAVALAALGLLATGILGFVIMRRLRRRQLPYTRRRSLLTPAELRFYHSLLRAIPDGLTVFVKVRLMDLVDVADSDWREFGAPGSGMHLDFVLADAINLEPRLVIELDDRSHSRAEVKQRDAFKNNALAAAGIRVLRIAAAAGYDAGGLRDRIGAGIG
jgi:hypothetical protein